MIHKLRTSLKFIRDLQGRILTLIRVSSVFLVQGVYPIKCLIYLEELAVTKASYELHHRNNLHEKFYTVQRLKIKFGATQQNSQVLSKDYTDEKVTRQVYFQVG